MYRRNNKCCGCNNWNNNCSSNNNCSNDDNLSDVLESKFDDIANLSAYDFNDDDSCGCGFDEEPSVFPDNPVLAQSYVPYQFLNKTFKPCVGLKMGTIFPELVSPYVPCQGNEEIEFIRATNKIGKGCNR